MAKQQKADPNTGGTGDQEEVARYEKELAGYLQERIKPGLNSGAIPLLARSIAKDIAHREHPNGASNGAAVEDEARAEADDEPSAEAEDDVAADQDDEPSAEEDDEPSAEEDDAEDDDEPSAEAEDEDSAASDTPPDFEADMRELQAELGQDWILRFSVRGDDGWLTAEKEDGSQHVEAPTASTIIEAVELLNERGGRSA